MLVIAMPVCRHAVLAPLLVLSSVFVNPVQAEITARHRAVTQETFDRLIAVIEKPEGWDVWPPTLDIVDSQEVQAIAYPSQTDSGLTPNVAVYVGLIEKVADFDPEILAFVVGHEIGHLVYFHSHKDMERRERYGKVKISTALAAANRDQELEADYFGMETALKAGYSHRGVRRALVAMAKSMGQDDYCSFEGLLATHPSWDLRASYLQKDEVQTELWQSMVAFKNGVLFLETENYIHAEFCFRKVTDEFPECYEGWANLGYALLMQYADAFDEEDLRNFDIGHLVVGGFYRRPDSLTEQVRGIDAEKWFEAVGAFREALRLKDRLGIKDDMIPVKANLAVAYLIHPNGKQVGEAEKYFSEVFQLLDDPDKAKLLDPLLKATILVNAGAGRPLDEERVAQAMQQLKQVARENPKTETQLESLTAALGYSQAKQLAATGRPDDKTSAVTLLEKYLTSISPASAWWAVAYEEYEQLVKSAGGTPKSVNEFKNPGVHDWRTVSSVTLMNGKTIGLAESFKDVDQALGEASTIVPVIEGTNLKRLLYKKHHISLLASRDVLAIFLDSPESPSVKITRPQLGGESRQISVGMTRKSLEALLGDEWEVEFASIDDPDQVYHLYRDVGIAVRYDDGKVREIVLVMVPRKAV